MTTQRYAVNQHMIESLLAKVHEGDIAIPEIQRPFVWDATQVRDLLDSLYKGFPVGYLIAWKNPDIKLKDGRVALGKMILIDGQQRVTALTAAILGQQVVNKDYKRINIRIAFHPLTQQFEVSNPIIEKNLTWIPDVGPIISGKTNLFDAFDQYASANPVADKKTVQQSLQTLSGIAKKQVGLIELNHDLDIETVTEIFIRINSKGTTLSQADFAMSKIAADSKYNGPVLRKAIDYFCHLAKEPGFYDQLKEHDKEFTATDYFQQMSWLRQDNDNLYDPSYTDVLRVTFGTEFGRGKLSDLVSLLSGRNFVTKQFEESIAEEAFGKMADGVRRFINETHFQRFVIIIKSAGFISSGMVRSQNALNFAYALYLRLRRQGAEEGQVERWVRRWFVLSILTGRFSGAAETHFERDLQLINEPDFSTVLERTEEAELSEAFWNLSLVQDLDVASTNHPLFWVFAAAQIKAHDRGMLSRDVTVHELVGNLGDVHHIFPRKLLRDAGYTKNSYNQIANYAFTQDSINIKIGSKSPHKYFADVLAQCEGQPLKLGSIDRIEDLHANLKANCLPQEIVSMTVEDYSEFLSMRRTLMAKKIRTYYESL